MPSKLLSAVVLQFYCKNIAISLILLAKQRNFYLHLQNIYYLIFCNCLLHSYLYDYSEKNKL